MIREITRFEVFLYVLKGIVEGFAIFFFCMLFHEGGHYLYFKLVLKRDVELKLKKVNSFHYKLQMGTKKDYMFLTDRQYFDLNLWGILAGFLPIFIHMAVSNSLISLLLIPVYLLGCKTDIKNIIEWE